MNDHVSSRLVEIPLIVFVFILRLLLFIPLLVMFVCPTSFPSGGDGGLLVSFMSQGRRFDPSGSRPIGSKLASSLKCHLTK